jgi:hypothetical protein
METLVIRFAQTTVSANEGTHLSIKSAPLGA